MGGVMVRKERRCPMFLLLHFICQAVLTAANSLPQLEPIVFTNADELKTLVEENNATLHMQVRIGEDEVLNGTSARWKVAARPLRESVASVALTGEEPSSFSLRDMRHDEESHLYTLNTSVLIIGRQLGKSAVAVRLIRVDDWTSDDDEKREDVSVEKEEQRGVHAREDENVAEVWVKRNKRSEMYTHIFVGVLMIIYPFTNILMGCELDTKIVLETVKRPVAPLIGMCTQFFIMPLLAYGISHAVFLPYREYSMALGLFVTGCSPGGGASNYWTLVLGGNVNLSVTMTFFSTLVSLVMMPLWLHLLGHEFLVGFGSNAHLVVPYMKITTSMVTLVGPMLIGIAIAKKFPVLASKARRIARPFIIFVLFFLLVFGAASNVYMFSLITARALLGGLLLPWCGFMCGCIASLVTRQTPPDVAAIAIETGIQNTGIAIILLKFSFQQPDADIASLLPVIVACFTPGPLLGAAAAHWLIKKMKGPMKEEGGGSIVGGGASNGVCPRTLALVVRPQEQKGMEKGSDQKTHVALHLPAQEQPSAPLVPPA